MKIFFVALLMQVQKPFYALVGLYHFTRLKIFNTDIFINIFEFKEFYVVVVVWIVWFLRGENSQNSTVILEIN
jgi:hypothetical protein